MHVDGNSNRITVEMTPHTCEGLPILIARLVDEPTHGYLVVDEGRGGFGDEHCHSSYGMSCLTWFGPGERYSSAEEAMEAVRDKN